MDSLYLTNASELFFSYEAFTEETFLQDSLVSFGITKKYSLDATATTTTNNNKYAYRFNGPPRNISN